MWCCPNHINPPNSIPLRLFPSWSFYHVNNHPQTLTPYKNPNPTPTPQTHPQQVSNPQPLNPHATPTHKQTPPPLTGVQLGVPAPDRDAPERDGRLVPRPQQGLQLQHAHAAEAVDGLRLGLEGCVLPCAACAAVDGLRLGLMCVCVCAFWGGVKGCVCGVCSR